MKTISEVTVYTIGDSHKISTWSNVPFFFTESLIAKGIKVNRVDISTTGNIERYLSKFYNLICRTISKETSYEYFRSYLNYLVTRQKIKKSIKKHKNSQVEIFLTFSFSALCLTNKPIVLFCDWTYDHYFNFLLGRKPDFFERLSIKREDKQILGSQLTFPLFPSVTDYMKNRYNNSDKIIYLGNVINSLYKTTEADLHLKNKSFQILFVGNKKYIEGARSLIAAYANLKLLLPDLTLHIIGLTDSHFDQLPIDVHCYGYLDKANDAERDLYYKLFREAKVFVNTTPRWGAFSASIEAMYFYTPVIVTPYSEFIKTFSDHIDFGCYFNENTINNLEELIYSIFKTPNYTQMCINAHHAVEDFTWDAYIDKILSNIKEKL